MYQIIASTLFQNKICKLPGIGTLVVVTQSAETDFVNTCIKAPRERIDFILEHNGEKVFNEFTAMSELLLKKLDETGSYFMNGIGSFAKEKEGPIQFTPIPIDYIFTPSVSAERVIRADTEHSLLVGDQQTTNVEMTGYLSEKKYLKDRWRIWAIVLATIGITALIFYFYRYGFNGVGNMKY